MADMLEAALWWAGKDVPVLPLHYPIDGHCSCGLATCANIGKHPIASYARKGLHSATTDEATIRKWWGEQPDANIGVRTGLTFDVIDVDSLEGAQALATLFGEFGTPENLGTAVSGRAGVGMHVYTVPGGQKALAGGKSAPAGVDVKGKGGYVVAPPSLHASGRRYAWKTCAFDSGEVQGSTPWGDFYGRLKTTPEPSPFRAPVPLEATASDAYGRAVVARAAELVSGAASGHRWQTLATEAVPLIARAVDGGLVDRDTATLELESAARDVGLSEQEIRRVPGLVDDLLQRGITNPIRGSRDRVDLAPLPVYDTEDEARADDWDRPWPLTHPAPAFPVGVFGWLAPYLNEVADTYQVPVDLAGMMLLSVTSALVGKTARVQVTPSWDEPLNTYIAVVLRAGETKSPVLSHLTKPLRALEAKEREAAQVEIGKATFQREVAEAKVKAAKEAAFKAKGDEFARAEAQNDALDAMAELDRIPVPILPLRLAGDMTPEALITKLGEQGGQLAHISAEGDLLDSIVGGRYSAGAPSIGGLLMAHDGREPVRVHRKHAEDIEVPDPCLTLGLAIQPDVLTKMGQSGAAMNRGLAARFLYSIPASRVGSRNMALSNRKGGGIEETSSKLLESLRNRLGAFGWNSEDKKDTINGEEIARGESIESNSTCAIRLFLEPSSLSILEHYRADIEARRRAGTGDLSDIAAWSNKLDGQAVRLAGLLQLLRDAGPEGSNPRSWPFNPQNIPVTPDAVADAVTLCDYLIQHAVEAHALMRATESGDREDRARQVLGWVKSNGEPEVTRRDIQQTLRRRASFRDADTIRIACDDLERAGYLRRLPDDASKPGRPSVRYLVNPYA